MQGTGLTGDIRLGIYGRVENPQNSIWKEENSEHILTLFCKSPQWMSPRMLGFISRSALGCRLLSMGGSSSKPEETPLECILKDWMFYKQIRWTVKHKFYCNTTWSLYKLRGWTKMAWKWVSKYNTILQLDLYCRKIGMFKPSRFFTKTLLYPAPVIKSLRNQKAFLTF